MDKEPNNLLLEEISALIQIFKGNSDQTTPTQRHPLYRAGLIKKNGTGPFVTDKGQTFLGTLLNTPLPVLYMKNPWVDPRD